MFTLSLLRQSSGRLYMRLLVLGALMAVIGISGCGEPPPEKPKPSALPKSTQKPLHKKKHVQTGIAVLHSAGLTWNDEKGRPLIVAKYSEGTMKQTDSQTVVQLHNVTADLYKNGKVTARMTAPTIDADRRTKEVKASGGVKVVSVVNGGTATSQTMIWKSKENMLYGSGNVKMTKDNMTLVGNTFVSDIPLTHAKISQGTAAIK